MIGFDINKESKDNNHEINNNSIIPWILLGVLGILFILVIAFNIYFFIFKKKRLIRANELDEDIIYNEKKDEDNKLGV